MPYSKFILDLLLSPSVKTLRMHKLINTEYRKKNLSLFKSKLQHCCKYEENDFVTQKILQKQVSILKYSGKDYSKLIWS